MAARPFEENEKGLTESEALQEAKRCLQCPKPRCIEGCPAKVNCREFIKLMREGHYESALQQIYERHYLPAFCGRVCDFGKQCEGNCVLAKGGRGIRVGKLERFLGDWEEEKGKPAKATGKKVAVVGSGPAGLSCAAHLALNGIKVRVFDAEKAFGGIGGWGIPPFRLPKSTVKKEIEKLERAGIGFENRKVEDFGGLLREFDAVFLGVGGGESSKMNIPGEALNGVWPANNFLRAVNLGGKPGLGKRVAVIGAGNVAVDSARTAKRLGCRVTIIYRRSEDEMPAIKSEIEHAKAEGVGFKFLLQPVEFLGKERVEAVKCEKMELGSADESCRAKPLPTGRFEEIATDSAIVATGQRMDAELLERNGIETDSQYIKVNDALETSVKGIFAAGDATHSPATVVEAASDGRKAAQEIIKFLGG